MKVSQSNGGSVSEGAKTDTIDVESIDKKLIDVFSMLPQARKVDLLNLLSHDSDDISSRNTTLC